MFERRNSEEERITRGKKKILLLILFLLIIFSLLFVFKVKEDMIDFEVNYTAGKRLAVGESLYHREDGHFMFKYFPASAILYLPLTFLPLDAAKGVWYFIVLFSLFSIVTISKEIVFSKRAKLLSAVLSFLILAKFFLRELQLGQINAVVTLVLLSMVRLMASRNERGSRKDIQAGILCGLASALKPYAVIFLPYFFIKKKWLSLVTALGFLAFALIIPSLFFGFQGNIAALREWISTLSSTTPFLLSSQDNISVIALFVKWTGNQTISLWLSTLVVILLAVLALRIILKGKRAAQAPVLECSLLLVCIPLVSPLGWDYTFLSSILAVMILVKNFFNYSKLWRVFLGVNFFVIAFSLYDLMGRELYSAFMTASVTTINFLILIAYLASLRFRKIC